MRGENSQRYVIGAKGELGSQGYKGYKVNTQLFKLKYTLCFVNSITYTV